MCIWAACPIGIQISTKTSIARLRSKHKTIIKSSFDIAEDTLDSNEIRWDKNCGGRGGAV